MYRAENTLKPLSPVCIMSSTSNVQNLLTNVFRPTFVYNTVTSNYQTKLELTNVDTVSANTVSAFAADVGDASGNVYVGIGAGNAHSVLSASSNTTNTFVGTGAGGATSNAKNAVFLGYRAGYGSSNTSNSISIGANTLNGGNSNTYIGCGTGIATGSNNIFLGAGVTNGGTSVSNMLLIGSGTNTTIMGDLVNKRVGVNVTSLPDPGTNIIFDVGGYTRITGSSSNGGLGINTNPGDYTLDVNGNMRVSDGYGVLIMSNDVNSNSTVTLRTTGTYPTATAAIVATGGFYSVNGTTGSVSNAATSNIGVWKKGLVMVVAQSTSSLIPDYASYAYCITIGTDGTYRAATTGLNAGANITITASTSNIVLTNNSTGYRTYTYSITYFPIP